MQWIIWALSVVIALFVGGYLKSYMSKKGENLATKEDVAEITQTQKRIENKISDEFWIKQRNRQLKEEIVLKAFKSAMVLQKAIRDFYTEIGMPHTLDGRKVVSAHREMDATFQDFFQQHLLVKIVCGPKVEDNFSLIAVLTMAISREYTSSGTVSEEKYDEVMRTLKSLIDAVKADFEISLPRV